MNCGTAVSPSSPSARQGCELESASVVSILPEYVMGGLADRIGGLRPCTNSRLHPIIQQPGGRSGAHHGGGTLSLRRQNTEKLRLQRAGAIQLRPGWRKTPPWHPQ